MPKFPSFKSLLALAVLALAGTAAPSGAALAEGAWCAEQGGRQGGSNCGYYTYRQCLSAISGVGGHCRRNSFYGAYPAEEKRVVRVYRRVYVYR